MADSGISSFLFQGSVPPQAPTGTDTTTNFPLWLQQSIFDTTNAGMNLAQQPFTPFPGQQVYTPSAQTTQAQALAGSNVGNWQPALSSSQNFINQGGALASGGAGLINQGSGLVNNAQNFVNQGGGFANSAADLTATGSAPITGQDINSFLNPFTNDVVSALQQQSNLNFAQNVLPNIQSQFVSAGQAASPQQMEADNRALFEQQSALNPAVSQALQSGFQGALTAAEQQKQRQLSGANQLTSLGGLAGSLAGQQGQLGALQGSLGTQQGQLGAQLGAFGAQEGQLGALQSQLGSFDVANLSASGQQQDILAQQNINSAIGNFNQQLNWPYQQLGFESGLLRGLPVGQTTQTAGQTFPPAFGASPFSTAIGTALGAQSLGIGAARGGHVRRGALQRFAAVGRPLARTAGYGDYGTALPGGADDWMQALNLNRRARDPNDPRPEDPIDTRHDQEGVDDFNRRMWQRHGEAGMAHMMHGGVFSPNYRRAA